MGRVLVGIALFIRGGGGVAVHRGARDSVHALKALGNRGGTKDWLGLIRLSGGFLMEWLLQGDLIVLVTALGGVAW
jgi:hypothetical protein